MKYYEGILPAPKAKVPCENTAIMSRVNKRIVMGEIFRPIFAVTWRET